MAESIKPIKLLFSITEGGKGRRLTEFFEKRNIHMHLQCSGVGTASSEMMDILGLGTSRKDIFLSFATEDAIMALVNDLNSNLDSVRAGKGIMMVLSPNAMGSLFAAIITRQTGDIAFEKGEDTMKSEYSHSLIFIAVNPGYTDKVMQTAKKAGATGGTVIRGRLAGAENVEKSHGISLNEEKEILTILAPDSIKNKIMEDVNAQFGMRTDAEAIVCAVPVDKAFKI